MKPYFHRVRPCNNPYIAGIIHLLVPCGSGLSFPSSHASNHFALGVFSAMTLGRRARWVWTAGIAWAVVVSFSQVYVGVHYPLDVTVGAIVGTTIGIIVGKIYNRYWDLKEQPAELTASEVAQ